MTPMNRLATLIHLAHTLLARYGTILPLALVFVVIILIILLFISRRVIRKQTMSLGVMEGFLSGFKPTNSLEYNLDQITQVATTVIRAPYYAFYVLDQRSSRYVLKTVSHPYDKLESVSPSYSGLSLPKRDPYIPPRTIILDRPADRGGAEGNTGSGDRGVSGGGGRGTGNSGSDGTSNANASGGASDGGNGDGKVNHNVDSGNHGDRDNRSDRRRRRDGAKRRGARRGTTATNAVAIRKEGEVTLLELRTPDSLAVLRIGPVEVVPKRIVKEFEQMLLRIGPAIDEMVQLTQEKQFLATSKMADEAIQKVAGMAVDATAAIDAVISVFAGAHAKGGILIPYRMDAQEPEVFGPQTLEETARLLYADAADVERLYALLGTQRYRIIQRSESLFYELPPALTNLDCGGLAFMAIDHRGLLILVLSPELDDTGMDGNAMDGKSIDGKAIDNTRISQLGLLAEQLSDISIFNRMQPMLSKAYSNMLWKLSDMIDNLSPHTVGYSEMMTRYSLAIGYQLNLSDSDMRDLALAAHVSNIGVLGIDPDLLSKQGKYTKFEADTMQMHCEIGASMIRVATGNQRAANMVLYHHERVDGLGFPSGLTGENIPIGSKIIHVVQVFLAKVNGRSWRSPQTFDEAIQTLRDATGTQLDEAVVKAFLEWFALKQMNPMVQGRSLARCDEMLSVPKSICETCPVSRRPTKNCWEVEGNQCAAHGRECSTCFVYTEYLSRERAQSGHTVGAWRSRQ
jgi:HD-GYP domain-containing protein (c-di-GMP phosphodiesterase class II)